MPHGKAENRELAVGPQYRGGLKDRNPGKLLEKPYQCFESKP